jgi:hypothetical protein
MLKDLATDQQIILTLPWLSALMDDLDLKPLWSKLGEN